MPFKIRLLGANVISIATTTPLYTVQAPALGAIVNNVRLVNTGAVTTVNLYFRATSGGAQVRILDRDKSIAAGDIFVVTPELTMAPGNLIELATVGTPSIEYVVSGVEKY